MRVEDNRKSAYYTLEELKEGECFEYGEGIMMKTYDGICNDIRVVDIRKGIVIRLPSSITVRLADVRAVIE